MEYKDSNRVEAYLQKPYREFLERLVRWREAETGKRFSRNDALRECIESHPEWEGFYPDWDKGHE